MQQHFFSTTNPHEGTRMKKSQDGFPARFSAGHQTMRFLGG
jgi:hypothetical protein